MRRIPLAAALATLVLGAPGVRAQLSQPLDSTVLSAFRWRSIGPANMMGRVTDVEGLPSPSTTFYVAAAAGGIWKTTNNGTTFRPVWDQTRVVSMGDLAIAPSDSNQVWAGTGEEDSRNSISPGGGVFKSTDGGLHWSYMGLKNTEVIGRIVVNPTNPDVVFVAALGHIWDSNPDRGLYRTEDGGKSWQRVKFVSDKAGFVDVAFKPGDPNTLFASSWQRVRGPYFLNSGGPGSALWKSTDGGDHWTEVTGGGFPSAEKGRIGIAISPSNPDVMYALVEAKKEADGSGGTGLYRSDDGGTTWKKMNDIDNRPFYYSQVRVDPKDPNRVYWSSTPMHFSPDGGKTIGTTTNDVHVDDHALWIDPNDGNRMVVGNDGGVAITYDQGGNWQYLNVIPIGQFYRVSYNMDIPYRVCGGLQDNGVWCGPSRLARGDIDNYRWATVYGGDGFYTAQDPVDPDILWAESQAGSMGRVNFATGQTDRLEKPSWEDHWRPYQDSIVTLENQGVSASDARIKDLQKRASADSAKYVLRWNWDTPFFQSVHDRRNFYAGANMVLKSTAFGDGLEPISPDLTYADPQKIKVSTETTGGITVDATGAETYATIVSLAESPMRQGMLFVGTDDGRVWTSPDDGGTWSELTDRFKGVPKGTYVSRIEPSHFDQDRFYVAFDNHRTNDFTPYVYVTDDGGKSFKSIANNLPTGGPDYVHVIREDPHNPNLLFVGTDLGVYVSTDRGASWQRFMTGLPTVPVRDLKIQPRDRDLIAATHGRAIWIVNIAALEGLTDKVVADGATLFRSPPAFQFGQEPRGGEDYGQHWFQRPTPGSTAQIAYFVGKDVASSLGSGDNGNRRPMAKIMISDASGKTVHTLNVPTTAGVHTVEWNFRGPPAPPQPLSPSERRDSLELAQRAKAVEDSLVAAGWDKEPLHRMIGLFTGETSPSAMFGGRGGFGGGAGARNPEAFQERPGESLGGRGGRESQYSRLRDLANIIKPGMSMRSVFRGRRGGGAALVDPGSYTVTMTIAGRTYTRRLTVERKKGFTAGTGGF